MSGTTEFEDMFCEPGQEAAEQPGPQEEPSFESAGPKVWIHAGLPASGKTTAAHELARELVAVLVDKDRANPLEDELCRAASGDPNDRDSQAYCELVYPVTVSVVGELVCGVLRTGAAAVVDMPLLSEARLALEQGMGLAGLMERTWGLPEGCAEVVWHEVDPDLQRERMVSRGAHRDEAKLADWEAYQERLAEQVPKLSDVREIVDSVVDGFGRKI